MRYPFFDPAISRYVRDRLIKECRVRGTSVHIARTTGCSQSHIANILDGTRRVGAEFAVAMCKYWGVKQSDLHRMAHEAYGSRLLEDIADEPRTHPELEATLEFCRDAYPAAFLLEFEAVARRKPDTPRMQWLVDLHAQFFGWLSRQSPADQSRYILLASAPLPSFAQVSEAVSGSRVTAK